MALMLFLLPDDLQDDVIDQEGRPVRLEKVFRNRLDVLYFPEQQSGIRDYRLPNAKIN